MRVRANVVREINEDALEQSYLVVCSIHMKEKKSQIVAKLSVCF